MLFDSNSNASVREFAQTFKTQQEERELADYDPLVLYSKSEAQLSIATAAAAIEKLRDAPIADQADFVAVLICKKR